MLSKVFDLFVQADRTLDRSQGGLGIGLTLVKRLVELHGGRVGVSSPGIGKGSEFTIRLPVLAELPGESADGRHSDTPVEGVSAGGVRVLVVDDNADVAESMAMVLRLLGYDVRALDRGRACALAEAERQCVRSWCSWTSACRV